ncbi:hypothetical protein HDU96_009188 [Phlyctochytrium bullatum]|nr:hypothetical protein HDU96_009188 [Phlyctochytrium bullatum]
MAHHSTRTQRSSKLIHLPILLIATVALHLAVSLLQLQGIQLGPVSTRIDQDTHFCEPIHPTETVRQPTNAWSALVFFFIPLLFPSHSSAPTLLRGSVSRSAMQWWVVVALWGLGATTFFYHASLSYVSEFLDMASVLFAVTLFWAFSVCRWFGWRRFGWVAVGLIFLVVAVNTVGYALGASLFDTITRVAAVMLVVSEYTRQVVGRAKAAGGWRMLWKKFCERIASTTPASSTAVPSKSSTSSKTISSSSDKSITDMVDVDLEQGIHRAMSGEKASRSSSITSSNPPEPQAPSEPLSTDLEDVRWLFAMTASFFVGIVAMALQSLPGLCLKQDGAFQLHAVWHVFAALGVYYGYFYCANEPF